jgi:hypothetical protein
LPNGSAPAPTLAATKAAMMRDSADSALRTPARTPAVSVPLIPTHAAVSASPARSEHSCAMAAAVPQPMTALPAVPANSWTGHRGGVASLAAAAPGGGNRDFTSPLPPPRGTRPFRRRRAPQRPASCPRSAAAAAHRSIPPARPSFPLPPSLPHRRTAHFEPRMHRAANLQSAGRHFSAAATPHKAPRRPP